MAKSKGRARVAYGLPRKYRALYKAYLKHFGHIPTPKPLSEYLPLVRGDNNAKNN